MEGHTSMDRHGCPISANDVRDSTRLISARGARAFVDGLVSVAFPVYLSANGMSPGRIGFIVTGTLLGSAALTLLIGLRAQRFSHVTLLCWLTVLMVSTGLGFALASGFAAMLIIGTLGTMNPSSGDVSPFLALEQALLPATGPDERRTHLFARYAMTASLAGAFGALVAGITDDFGRWLFLAYAACAILLLALYRTLSIGDQPRRPTGALTHSRRRVLELSLLFSIDAFGGGFVVQSMLVLWLGHRFHLSTTSIATLLFITGVAASGSTLLAPRVASRIGLVKTMVFTHIPASLCLIAAAFAPSASIAVALLVARSLVSTMDVPARTSYVMAIVPPDERAAAASVTNVPRSLAAAIPPLITGAILDRTNFGWPLIIAGVLKITYDLLLLIRFRGIRPAEETERLANRSTIRS